MNDEDFKVKVIIMKNTLSKIKDINYPDSEEEVIIVTSKENYRTNLTIPTHLN
jgi:hypothetical protein